MVIIMNKIDLSNYNIRCDLITDINIKIDRKIESISGIEIESVNLNSNKAKKINKRKGNYISIFFDDVTDKDNYKNVKNIVKNEIKKLLQKKELLGKSCLVIGLGNRLSTPDSLGPKVIDNIIATRHLYDFGNVDKDYSKVSKISPGVYGISGIETFDIVKGIVEKIKPDYIIIIDALSSTSIKKVNKVVQITDSGIEPGSGIGNQRKELSKKTLKKEVIAIGVPTVVSLHTIVKDFLNEYDVDELLKEKGNNFMVTPKEIDFEIDKLSLLISSSINETIHNLTK